MPKRDPTLVRWDQQTDTFDRDSTDRLPAKQPEAQPTIVGFQRVLQQSISQRVTITLASSSVDLRVPSPDRAHHSCPLGWRSRNTIRWAYACIVPVKVHKIDRVAHIRRLLRRTVTLARGKQHQPMCTIVKVRRQANRGRSRIG